MITVDFINSFKIFNENVDLLKNEVKKDPEKRDPEVKVIIEKLEKNSHSKNAPSLDDKKLIKKLENIINERASYLPGCYQKNYVDPLVNHLGSVHHRFAGTIETLAGVVYDHSNPNVDIRKSLQRFLAFTSNIYRSFMEPENLPLSNFPKPDMPLPALTTFRPVLEWPYIVPYTLPTEEVFRICGARVPVVSLPSSYREHPVITWASIAHEAGGHDVLHAYRGLLGELKEGVRGLFYKGRDPQGGEPETKRQYLGLLWQYWTEETASDVYAVMNLGPAYGIALAIWFATLSKQIREAPQVKGTPFDDPTLTVSSRSPRFGPHIVDYHPTQVLALYAIIGAIDALPLDEGVKKQYIDAMEKCIDICMKNNRKYVKKIKDSQPEEKQIEALPYKTDLALIQGRLQIKSGTWAFLQAKNPNVRIKLADMQNYARHVGYYIATAKLQAFNGYGIQDLETWDNKDDEESKKITQFIDSPIHAFIRQLGFQDDAQIFSGAVFSFVKDPTNQRYTKINQNLGIALDTSFGYDAIWGKAGWHPLAEVTKEVKKPGSK
jgi:hypothetical protein